MKHQFVVYALFQDVAVKHANQHTRVAATGFQQAAKAALRELMNRDGIKRRRHSRIKLTIARVPSPAPKGGSPCARP